MSHWDEKKPTRYRAKAGPEVVLRKVSVLFAISSMPKRAIGKRTESFSEWTILFALNLLCRKRAIEQTGQSRFEKGIRPFRYKFYAEMSHWDNKKPTRYRAKAGPEVVLRKVSVLFAISSMPKRAIETDRAKSF